MSSEDQMLSLGTHFALITHCGRRSVFFVSLASDKSNGMSFGLSPIGSDIWIPNITCMSNTPPLLIVTQLLGVLFLVNNPHRLPLFSIRYLKPNEAKR